MSGHGAYRGDFTALAPKSNTAIIVPGVLANSGLRKLYSQALSSYNEVAVQVTPPESE